MAEPRGPAAVPPYPHRLLLEPQSAAARRPPRVASAHDADRAGAAPGARGRRARAGDRPQVAGRPAIDLRPRGPQGRADDQPSERGAQAGRETRNGHRPVQHRGGRGAARRAARSRELSEPVDDRRASTGMLAELIAYSGARPQDALALSYARVGTKRIVYAEKNVDGRIVPGSKTGEDRARSITLLASLRKDLLAFRLAAGNPPDDALVLPQAEGRPWRLHDYKTGSATRSRPNAPAARRASSRRPSRLSEDPTRRPTSCAVRTPASASPSSAAHSKRSPRRWATRSRSSRAPTRASSRSTAAAGPSPPTRSSRAPAATQKRPKPHHQQLELLKPTGGLEPPTPSLRVLPTCPWWGSRGHIGQ